MANTTISPNMGLIVPAVGLDPGPDWANNLNASLGAIDSHNHTSGQGVQIPPAGLNINANLTFQGNSATNVQSTVFTVQPSLATLDAIYVKGVDLYFNDGSGNVIQLTSGGSVNATSSGISSGSASASFVSSVLVVNENTNTPANIQVGSVLLGNNTTAGNFITLQPPSLSSSYSLTLPTQPASTLFVTLTSAGVFGTTSGISAGQIATGSIVGTQLANQTVGAAQITNGTITTTQIAPSTIIGANMASDNNYPGNGCEIGGRFNVTANANSTLNSGLGIIRGGVSSAGTLTFGEGFSVSRSSTGVYVITYSGGFADTPVVTITTNSGSANFGVMNGNSSSACTLNILNLSGSLTNDSFYFIAIGQKPT